MWVRWVLMVVSFTNLHEGERDFESNFGLLRKHEYLFVRPMSLLFSPKTGETIELDALFEIMEKWI